MPAPDLPDPNLMFLYLCIKHSDMKKINYAAVGAAMGLNVPAAQMRWSRLRKKIESGMPAENRAKGSGGGDADGDEEADADASSMAMTPSPSKKRKVPAPKEKGAKAKGKKGGKGKGKVHLDDTEDEEMGGTGGVAVKDEPSDAEI
ncbi:uncharacterized protein BDV17DRAFT_295864 [Aspergillus undulatus]|uniref:uncharacterized protein n=1 Tax=Aspergillus undulatus TaxID=1810928 RepID=UPI003CCCF92E